MCIIDTREMYVVKDNDYKFDYEANMYYSEALNKYITRNEYLRLGVNKCKGCNKDLYENELCWCRGDNSE